MEYSLKLSLKDLREEIKNSINADDYFVSLDNDNPLPVPKEFEEDLNISHICTKNSILIKSPIKQLQEKENIVQNFANKVNLDTNNCVIPKDKVRIFTGSECEKCDRIIQFLKFDIKVIYKVMTLVY